MNQRQCRATLMGEDERLLEAPNQERAETVWAYFVQNWKPGYLDYTPRYAAVCMKRDVRKAMQREHGIVRFDPLTLFILGILVNIIIRWLFSKRPEHSEMMLSWQAER